MARSPADSPLPLPWLTGPAGELLLQPWFDRVALRAVTRWYLPLSRGWAAADAAGGSLERLRSSLPVGAAPDTMLRWPLAQVSDRRRRLDAAAAAWEEAFFGSAARRSDRQLAAVERQRRAAAVAFMNARGSLLPLHMLRLLPAVRWDLPEPAMVEDRHGARLAAAAAAYPPSAAQPVASAVVCNERYQLSWLRFPTTVAGMPEVAWARVESPPGVADPPTLIFCHGVAMETEFWPTDAGIAEWLLAAGVRLIRPEGPWHGRRRAMGWAGGEPVIARGPLGLLDLFQAWVAELAALIAWARATSRGAVAIGGISLGALTAQLAAAAARTWPSAQCPDALLLVATTGRLVDLATGSSLVRALGLPTRLAQLGWGPDVFRRWQPLLDPAAELAVPGERIVMVLGDEDDVTPYPGGRAAAAQWQVPAENLFVRHRGHFSVGLGLLVDQQPLDRLRRLLG